MPASTVRRNHKGAENVTRLIRSAEEYGDAYLIVDRLLVQHDGRRERLARNRAAGSIEGEGPSRSHERIVKVYRLAGYAAAMSRNPGDRRQQALPGERGTGVAGQATRRYSYAPFLRRQGLFAAALVPVKA